VFVSSISVYADLARTAEGDAPLRTLEDAEHAALTLERYGALKAACEAALEEELPGRVLAVRAGLILGPHDYDARFRYWLTRVARGGEVLAPGAPDATAQAIDVRDLAGWMLDCAARGVRGTFNATGAPLAMSALLAAVRAAVGGDARFVWVPDALLLEHGVRPYSEMPFWLPASMGAAPVDVARARAEGLVVRPFADTARDTWAWMQAGWDDEESVRLNRKFRVPAGISAERERAILAAAARSAGAP
jgi:2'-hydroxyisoflavone reductase